MQESARIRNDDAQVEMVRLGPLVEIDVPFVASAPKCYGSCFRDREPVNEGRPQKVLDL